MGPRPPRLLCSRPFSTSTSMTPRFDLALEEPRSCYPAQVTSVSLWAFTLPTIYMQERYCKRCPLLPSACPPACPELLSSLRGVLHLCPHSQWSQTQNISLSEGDFYQSKTPKKPLIMAESRRASQRRAIPVIHTSEVTGAIPTLIC